MHELAVTEHILALALRHAQQADAARITDLYLVIGELASIVDDSVQFYWEIVSADTIAADARLHFRRVAAAMRCDHCHTTWSPLQTLRCPACGRHTTTIIAGEEFLLEAIDVEHHPQEVTAP